VGFYQRKLPDPKPPSSDSNAKTRNSLDQIYAVAYPVIGAGLHRDPDLDKRFCDIFFSPPSELTVTEFRRAWLTRIEAMPDEKLEAFLEEHHIVERLVDHMEQLEKDIGEIESVGEKDWEKIQKQRVTRLGGSLDPFIGELARFLAARSKFGGAEMQPGQLDREKIDLWKRLSRPIADLIVRADFIVESLQPYVRHD
jgi:hypothetical protein